MYIDQWVKVIWGGTVITTSIMGAFRRRWLIVTFLMGVNIVQEAFTGW